MFDVGCAREIFHLEDPSNNTTVANKPEPWVFHHSLQFAHGTFHKNRQRVGTHGIDMPQDACTLTLRRGPTRPQDQQPAGEQESRRRRTTKVHGSRHNIPQIRPRRDADRPALAYVYVRASGNPAYTYLSAVAGHTNGLRAWRLCTQIAVTTTAGVYMLLHADAVDRIIR